MKLSVKKFEDLDFWRMALKIEAETETGQKELSFIEGEPEDANLGRDFADVYNIEDLVKMAYEAGKNGEPLEIDRKVYDSFEEL